MARTYHPTLFLRGANAVMSLLLRNGVKVGSNALLTVPGRKSGEPRTTPVTPLEGDGERWVQSPYGDVNWVRNLRAAGQGTLTRGRRTEAFSAVELTPAETARVLQAHLSSFPSLVRDYFDVTPESSLEAFEREAPRHPMVRITRTPTPAERP